MDKTQIYIGNTTLNKEDFFNLFEFYDLNGLEDDDDDWENWLTENMQLDEYDEEYCFIDYKKNFSLKNFVEENIISSIYRIPRNIINQYNHIDFVIGIDVEAFYPPAPPKLNTFIDENTNIKYIGTFDTEYKF